MRLEGLLHGLFGDLAKESTGAFDPYIRLYGMGREISVRNLSTDLFFISNWRYTNENAKCPWGSSLAIDMRTSKGRQLTCFCCCVVWVMYGFILRQLLLHLLFSVSLFLSQGHLMYRSLSIDWIGTHFPSVHLVERTSSFGCCCATSAYNFSFLVVSFAHSISTFYLTSMRYESSPSYSICSRR